MYFCISGVWLSNISMLAGNYIKLFCVCEVMCGVQELFEVGVNDL